VRQDESPWTAAELRNVRKGLTEEIQIHEAEVHQAEGELEDLLRGSGDGAGDDQADAGAKTFEREHEITLANNARDMLRQAEHALERLDSGTYGTCEICGNPIGKGRLQAFPRATLCVTCKTKQERH
jgi:DnaK suppressor protein